jgi:hypothetical protein
MKFLRFIGRILEHGLAMLAGMIFFPLRALFFGSILAIFAIFVGAALLAALTFVAPVLLAKHLISKGLSTVGALFLTPVAALVIFLLTIMALSIVAIGLLILTPLFLIDSAYRGVKAGFFRGFSGLIYRLEEDFSFFEKVYYGIRKIRSSEQIPPNVGENGIMREVIVDAEGWQVPGEEMEDVPVAQALQEIPDMEDKTVIPSSALLSPQELQSAEIIMITPTRAIEKLQVLTERYVALSKNLEKIHRALVAGNLSEVKDEIIPNIEIETPILFEKQYFQNSTWHTIPAHSHVSDKKFLLMWFAINPKHPLTMDSILEPSYYKGMRTRYQWRALTAEDCQSRELYETAEQIKALLVTIQEAPVEIATPVKDVRSKSLSEAEASKFFSRPESSGSEPLGGEAEMKKRC